MKLGFTGTRNGMTEMQSQFVFNAMMDCNPDEVHHGMCIGSDEELDGMTDYLSGATVIGHPANIPSMRGNCSCDVVLEEKPPLDRNKDIVDATDTMIAAPDGAERLRSGTWSTIRYAHKKGKRVYVVYPSGKTEWYADTLPQPTHTIG